jgi:hypothetical protein
VQQVYRKGEEKHKKEKEQLLQGHACIVEDAFPFVFVGLDLQELTYVRMGCLIKVHESKDNKEQSAGKRDFRERGISVKFMQSKNTLSNKI